MIAITFKPDKLTYSFFQILQYDIGGNEDNDNYNDYVDCNAYHSNYEDDSDDNVGNYNSDTYDIDYKGNLQILTTRQDLGVGT